MDYRAAAAAPPADAHKVEADAVVIGAGIAGVSVAYELAAKFNVIVLEKEPQPGYHATGRSAALFSELYGNSLVRGLSRGSREFLLAPPSGFTAAPLLAPRGALFIATREQQPAFEAMCTPEAERSIRMLSRAETLALVPILQPEQLDLSVLEFGAMDVAVHALQQGYLKSLRARGGELICNCSIRSIHRTRRLWHIETGDRTYAAPLLVNAAGAWADIVAQSAGVEPIGVMPRRRTALLIDPPAHMSIDRWPAVVNCDETLYFKPDAGKLLVSPADATPSEPCDAQPEDLDVAIGVDRFERATTLTVNRVTHKWAGLRTFVADGSPVVGFDRKAEGFFWVVGQGGYGVQTAPAIARAAAAIASGREIPLDLRERGISERSLSPATFGPDVHQPVPVNRSIADP